MASQAIIKSHLYHVETVRRFLYKEASSETYMDSFVFKKVDKKIIQNSTNKPIPGCSHRMFSITYCYSEDYRFGQADYYEEGRVELFIWLGEEIGRMVLS